MPKDTRVNSSSFDRSTVSPYACSSKKIADGNNSGTSLSPFGDEREWDETRCPICMEHPHNAVLLICSSYEKGCRPFMCNTSIRQSNCLDQFRNTSLAESPPEKPQPELACPLCRGLIIGWVVVEDARRFMNSKRRICSLETCGFSGNYAELREHAWLEHPCCRPSVPSPSRQSNWSELEQEIDTQDALLREIDGWPSGDEEDEYDMLSDESFLDFFIGMPNFEDVVGHLSSDRILLDNFLTYYEEMVGSGGSRSNIERGNALSSPRSGSSYYDRSPSSYHIGRERRYTTSSGSRSRQSYGSSYDRSPSSYHIDREMRYTTSSRSRSRQSYLHDGTGSNSRRRSNHHMGNAPTSSRTRSSYRWGDIPPTRDSGARPGAVPARRVRRFAIRDFPEGFNQN